MIGFVVAPIEDLVCLGHECGLMIGNHDWKLAE